MRVIWPDLKFVSSRPVIFGYLGRGIRQILNAGWRLYLVLGLLLISGHATAAYYRAETCSTVTTSYPWLDIASSGNAIALSDDGVSGNISLGFTFNFGGSNFTRLRIGANGWLFFSGTATTYINTALPAAGVDAVLMPFWDDLNPASVASRIRYQTLGTSPNRVFVVSFLAVPHYCGGGSGCSNSQTTGITETFQVQLFETTGEVVFSYSNMSTLGGGWTTGPVPAGGLPEQGATIGVEVSSSDYTQFSSNTDSLTNGSSLLFTPTSTAPKCAGFHHLRLEHTGSGVTCAPTTLTIKACADALCSSLYTGGVTGTLTAVGASTVNWVGGASFAIGATGLVTKDVQVTTAGTVTWGASGVAPVASSGTACYIGATASCSFTSSLAGFLFDVPNHYANTTQSITVSSVKQSDNSLACVPGFISTSKTINFSCAYSDPVTGTMPVAVGGSNVSCGTTTGVTLSFNASGVATTTVSYADVGRMTLTASYTGSSGSEIGLVMTGSDTFITAPASFTVVPVGPYSAGNPFRVTVTAKNASGGATPNFGKESTTENVALTHTLVGPPGGNNPALSGTTTLLDAIFQSGNGVATTNSITWGEVGDISLIATLASGSYLGSGLGATGNAAAGPFKPAYFDTTVVPGTGSFTYSGQPFRVTVTAKNASGTTTQNYKGSYAKNVTLTDANSATNNSIGLGNLANASIAAASFISNGEATVTNPTYSYTSKTTAPFEAPTSAPLKLRATDTDGVTSSGHTEETTPIRGGRLRLVNFYGSNLLKPRVEYRAEYWNGNRWATNTLDSTTSIAAGNIATGGLTVSTMTMLAAGEGAITFNIAAAGSYDIAFDLNAAGVDTSCNAAHAGSPANKPWLQGYWSAPANCGGVAAWAQDPNARVRLGSPRAPYIYMRERY